MGVSSPALLSLCQARLWVAEPVREQLGQLWLNSLATLWCHRLLLPLLSNPIPGCSVELNPDFSWVIPERVRLLFC